MNIWLVILDMAILLLGYLVANWLVVRYKVDRHSWLFYLAGAWALWIVIKVEGVLK